ncbi:MAG: hypothetical protein Q8R92_16980 [Deltaproteobacteria bacterium]|nr:hypothetical protein [Deltaproteobacteria bacterium]
MNAVGSVVTGKPITAGGLLTGAVTGGFGSIVSSYVGGMFPDSPFIGQVAGMAAGALAGGLIGQATGTGAGQGAASGGAGGVTGAVTTAPTVNNLPTFGQSGQGILSFNPVERRPIDWAAKRG